MKLITKEEYENFKKQRNKINELILVKTIQLSMILYNEPPNGECYNYDFEEENGKIFVEFEYGQCQETCRDQYYLPIEFLFDETYPEKYKKIHEEDVKKREEEKLRLKKEKEDERKRILEEFEIKEYKRLKNKFEKDNCNINIKVDEIWSEGDDKL
jgi:hypothetical protein